LVKLCSFNYDNPNNTLHNNYGCCYDKDKQTTTTALATVTTMHIHDISTHLTVLVCPVQSWQLFQAEFLSAGVNLVLAVHWPLVG